MSGYTKGPWVVRQWRGEEWPEKRISIGPEDESASTAVLISPRYPSQRTWSDAALAAAAPDLLEALENTAKALERYDSGHPLIADANIAIAKAKGET